MCLSRVYTIMFNKSLYINIFFISIHGKIRTADVNVIKDNYDKHDDSNRMCLLGFLELLSLLDFRLLPSLPANTAADTAQHRQPQKPSYQLLSWTRPLISSAMETKNTSTSGWTRRQELVVCSTGRRGDVLPHCSKLIIM